MSLYIGLQHIYLSMNPLKLYNNSQFVNKWSRSFHLLARSNYRGCRHCRGYYHFIYFETTNFKYISALSYIDIIKIILIWSTQFLLSLTVSFQAFTPALTTGNTHLLRGIALLTTQLVSSVQGWPTAHRVSIYVYLCQLYICLCMSE